jgi:hypothetical protein
MSSSKSIKEQKGSSQYTGTILSPKYTVRYAACQLEIDHISTILEYQGNDAGEPGIYETTTYRRANPYGAEGPKTISYEILEKLSEVPDVLWVKPFPLRSAKPCQMPTAAPDRCASVWL